jgi:hypothetical protein
MLVVRHHGCHAMSETVAIALFLALLLLAGGGLYARERNRRRAALTRWAASQGYRVLRSRQPFLREASPFPISVSKAQQVFQITVECNDGTAKSGWVLLGSGLSGLDSGAAKVEWDL